MMKTSLMILFLTSISFLYAQESKDVKPEKWRLNLSGGYAYRLGSTDKAEKDMAQSLVDPSVANDYYSKMKFGPQANADVHYLFRPNMGLGICYSFFTSSPNEKNVLFNPYDGVHYLMGDMSESVYVNYIGPSFLMKEFINEKKTWSTSVLLSLGYASYRDEANLMNRNVLITGGSFASNMTLGIEYALSKNIAIGLDAGAFFSTLTKVKLTDGSTTVDNDLKDNKENLSRLNLSLGIRFYK